MILQNLPKRSELLDQIKSAGLFSEEIEDLYCNNMLTIQHKKSVAEFLADAAKAKASVIYYNYNNVVIPNLIVSPKIAKLAYYCYFNESTFNTIKGALLTETQLTNELILENPEFTGTIIIRLSDYERNELQETMNATQYLIDFYANVKAVDEQGIGHINLTLAYVKDNCIHQVKYTNGLPNLTLNAQEKIRLINDTFDIY